MERDEDTLNSPKESFIAPPKRLDGEPKINCRYESLYEDDDEDEEFETRSRSKSVKASKLNEVTPRAYHFSQRNQRNIYQDNLETIESDNDEMIPISVKRQSHNVNSFCDDHSQESIGHNSNGSDYLSSKFKQKPTEIMNEFSFDQSLRHTLDLCNDTQMFNETLRQKELQILNLENSLKEANITISELCNNNEIIRRKDLDSHTNSTRSDSGFSDNRFSNPPKTSQNFDITSVDFSQEIENLTELKNERHEWETYACRLTRLMVEKERFFITQDSRDNMSRSKFKTEEEYRWSRFSIELLRILVTKCPLEVNNLLKLGYSDLMEKTSFSTKLTGLFR